MLGKAHRKALDEFGLVQFEAKSADVRRILKLTEDGGFYWGERGKVFREDLLLKAGCIHGDVAGVAS